VKDKIIVAPKGALFRWMMVNLARVEIKGLDVSVQTAWSPGDNTVLNATAKYTLQQARDMSSKGDSYYRQQIPYIPVHSGSFIAGAVVRNWCFNYSFIYTGERYDQSENIPENYIQPRYSHDLSVSKRFGFRKNTVKLMAEVNNVFNQDFDVVTNYPMPGRYYRFSIQLSY
jgi:outer membrane receptor protein involved in Fe transport